MNPPDDPKPIIEAIAKAKANAAPSDPKGSGDRLDEGDQVQGTTLPVTGEEIKDLANDAEGG